MDLSKAKYTILNEHLEFKKTSVRSPEKIKDIQRYLTALLNSSNKPIDKFTEEDIARFLNSLNDKYSIGTINDIKIYTKVFLKWKFTDWSSRFRNLDKLCRNQKAPSTYSADDMIPKEDFEKLVNEEQDLMYKVYWLVFFYGGFRPSECCNLLWEQVYFEPQGVIIKMRTSKTNKDFYKSIPKNAEHFLKEWRNHNPSIYLFPSIKKNNKPIIARSVCGRLKRLSKRVLGKEVVPYQLRHSIATILYGNDKIKDSDTANQLGHSKSMKSVYMNLDEDSIKTKARSLWIKIKKINPEKEKELEENYLELKKQVEEIQKRMKEDFDKNMEILKN